MKLFLALLFALPSPHSKADTEILRDPWGIPHIFAESDADAFFALGYAVAEDRGFQMHYNRRLIQGRLAETIGIVKKLNRDETSLDHDQKMRTFGFYRAAQKTAENLDPETKALLQAYADGVNTYFASDAHKSDPHPLFTSLGLTPEPWTPADCIAAWWHLGQFFATDGTRDLIAGRNQGRQPLPPTGLKILPPDEAPAVVQRPDLDPNWIAEVESYAAAHAPEESAPDQKTEGPKFSHAWVVGGENTTTGSSVLISDPQTPVRNPSLFHEFHIAGKSFNARGIGVPGSPILLIGFSENVAWGVTALGADQADLFKIKTDPARPDEYLFEGNWRKMETRREVIKVKGRDPIDYPVRETHLGPVATRFCFARPDDGEVALKRIPVAETDRETIQGALAMMRAQNAAEFDSALAGWRFPSINILFGDSQGAIGFRALAAIPVRSKTDPTQGRSALHADSAEDDWQDFIPTRLLPGVQNPASGYLYSGNHRAIGEWYPLHLGAMTGTGGDTTRSWRLRERLEAQKGKFTPEDVLAIHFDSVNPARRDIVKLALHLRDAQKYPLDKSAIAALEILEPWLKDGASTSLGTPGATLALQLNTFFRFVATDLAHIYGGGESGLAYFLKSATARIEADPAAVLAEPEIQFIENALASAMEIHSAPKMPRAIDDDVEAHSDGLGYLETLDGFPALDRKHEIPHPNIQVVDGGTIGCQSSQSYTQFVPMHDPDQAMSILPPGQSDRPGHHSRLSTLNLYSDKKLHPAPLSKEKVKALGVTRTQVAPRHR